MLEELSTTTFESRFSLSAIFGGGRFADVFLLGVPQLLDPSPAASLLLFAYFRIPQLKQKTFPIISRSGSKRL